MLALLAMQAKTALLAMLAMLAALTRDVKEDSDQKSPWCKGKRRPGWHRPPRLNPSNMMSLLTRRVYSAYSITPILAKYGGNV